MPQKNNSNKLVLFDIDGTLIRSKTIANSLSRFQYAIQKVFEIDVGAFTPELFKERNYNGTGDRYIFWDLLKDRDVSRDMYIDRIGALGDAFCEYMDELSKNEVLYEAIPEAKALVSHVVASPHLSVGVLTGNLRQSASWKLKHTGYQDFAFGVYGHEADHRNDLAKLVMPKAEVFYKKRFDPSDIIIIGDTPHDVVCARAIGAIAVIVGTGWELVESDFASQPPDLYVDTLMDERVLDLLGLKP